MLRNRYVIGGIIIAVLIVANIVSYFYSNWDLITIKAHEEPLGQIVRSIERQGWVKIYTDLDLTQPVSMYVDKVPLAEAMETLTANLGGTGGGGGGNPAPGGSANGAAGAGGAARGGGFGGGGQWKLGFFVAPTYSQVKEEIHAFESGATDDDTKIYSFPTSLTMLASDSDMPAADPRHQIWSGLKAPDPSLIPPPSADDQQQDSSPPPPPSTLQDYLQLVAEQSDVFIMAPGSWNPAVAGPPAPSSSLISAVKSLVSSARGSVVEAIVLRQRQWRRPPDGARPENHEADTGWAIERMRNAINGLPEDARPAALAQLDTEVKFQHDLQAAPPDQRRAMRRQHMASRMGGNFFRMSPEKRAQMYQRVVGNRETARGQ